MTTIELSPDTLYLELIKDMKRARSQAEYLPVNARAMLVAVAFCGDQEEAKVMIEGIQREWGL